MQAKKKVERDRLMAPLKEIAADVRVNRNFGDSMILNAAFLVSREKEAKFDVAVEGLARRNAGKMNLRFVGPLPICNFVEIVVSWS